MITFDLEGRGKGTGGRNSACPSLSIPPFSPSLFSPWQKGFNQSLLHAAWPFCKDAKFCASAQLAGSGNKGMLSLGDMGVGWGLRGASVGF